MKNSVSSKLLFRFFVLSLLLVCAPGFFPLSRIQAQANANTNKDDGKNKGVRIKELARIVGIRSNQLLGYGLVVGLPGSGDSRSKLASESIRNLLRNLGQKLPRAGENAKNIAAVLVTANLPPFARKGARMDIVVSSIGDARSLEGGVLIQTPLKAGDGVIYAVAQGVITTGGRGRGTERELRQTGRTVGLVLGGASVEKDPSTNFSENRRIRVSLNHFDFTTLNTVKKAVAATFPGVTVSSADGSVLIDIPVNTDPVEFISKLEEIRVVPSSRARVVINERTGTIVMGGDIRVDPVSVSRGPLKLILTGKGNTTSTGVSSELEIKYGPEAENSTKGKMRPVTNEFQATSVSEIVQALNAMGATVQDIIAILEALKESGALHAELKVI